MLYYVQDYVLARFSGTSSSLLKGSSFTVCPLVCYNYLNVYVWILSMVMFVTGYS